MEMQHKRTSNRQFHMNSTKSTNFYKKFSPENLATRATVGLNIFDHFCEFNSMFLLLFKNDVRRVIVSLQNFRFAVSSGEYIRTHSQYGTFNFVPNCIHYYLLYVTCIFHSLGQYKMDLQNTEILFGSVRTMNAQTSVFYFIHSFHKFLPKKILMKLKEMCLQTIDHFSWKCW